MEEISNKTIAVLLVIAVVVSIGGTIISLNKLSQIRGLRGPLAGAATTGIGVVNLSVETSLDIMVTGNINFGAGHVNAGSPVASMNSSLTSTANGTWAWNTQFIKVNSTGTVNISLNVSANATAATFIGGLSPVAQIWPNQTSCGSDAHTTCASAPLPINGSQQVFCSKLVFPGYSTGACNSVNVSAFVAVPSNAVVGEKNVQLTFTSSQNNE